MLLAGFGVGVWLGAGRRRGLRATAVMLLAVAAFGLVWPPMHRRGTVFTLADELHIVFAAVTSVLILSAIASGARAFGRRFQRYSIGTLGVLLVSGALTFLYAPRLAADLPTPWLGLIERVNLGAYLLWVAVLAVALLRAPARPD